MASGASGHIRLLATVDCALGTLARLLHAVEGPAVGAVAGAQAMLVCAGFGAIDAWHVQRLSAAAVSHPGRLVVVVVVVAGVFVS